jgi:hypothetical protein
VTEKFTVKTHRNSGWMIALALGVAAGGSAGETFDSAGGLKKPIPGKFGGADLR